MAPTSADDRIAALEEHARAANEALISAIDHIRALVVVNSALIAQLSKGERDAVRQAALAALVGADHAKSRALVEALTLTPMPGTNSDRGERCPADAMVRLQ